MEISGILNVAHLFIGSFAALIPLLHPMSSLTLGLLIGIVLVSASNASLLALSGDQLAQQYLTQRLGFLENVIFSCSPLGILTAVTSAIRVSGPVALRALIGRSQEPSSRVELELLKSTSSNVCELWDGGQVVRTFGSPDMTEFVYDEEGYVHNRDEVMKLRPHHTLMWRLFSFLWSRRQPSDVEVSELNQLYSTSNNAPNLFLNQNVGQTFEVRLIGLTASVLQLSAMIFNFYSVYDFRRRNILEDGGRARDGLFLTVVGTLAMFFGIFICCCAIESRTRVASWVARDKHQTFRIVWLQKSQTLNGQNFNSYAIFADSSQHEIITSRLDHKSHLGAWSLLGTLFTASGFIAQVLGLRNMPYQAAISHCVSTAIMTILRLVLRRPSSHQPSKDYNLNIGEPLTTFWTAKLEKGHELNELAKILTGCKEWSISTEHSWERSDLEDHGPEFMPRKVLQNRLIMSKTCDMSNSVKSLAETVCKTMDNMMDVIWTTRVKHLDEIEQLHWKIMASTIGNGHFSGKLSILALRSGNVWRVDRSTIESILDLWIWHLRRSGGGGMRNNMWLLSFDTKYECDYFQALLNLLDPTGSGLESIINVTHFCRLNHIGHGRTLYGGLTRTERASKRAMIGQSDLPSMCAQYLIMAFLSQMAPYIEEPAAALSLETEPNSCSLRVIDPFFEKLRTLLQYSGLTTQEDSYKIIFCALAHSGKLLNLLSILPQLVKASSVQGGDVIKVTFSTICRLVRWNVITLASKGSLTEATEFGLSIIGAFTEVFGYQQEETLKIKRVVQEVLVDIESGRYTIKSPISNDYSSLDEKTPLAAATEQNLIDTSYVTQMDEKKLLVDIEEISIDRSPDTWLHENVAKQYYFAAKNKAPSEESFKAAIRASNVDTVRTNLLFDCSDYPKFLFNGIITAYDGIKERSTFERTEIIRLLILSGSGHDFGYLINITTFLGLAAQVGNIKLGELLLRKAHEISYQLDIYRALYTAIEYDQDDFFRFLLQSSNKVDMNDRNGKNTLLHAAYYGRESIVRYLMNLGISIQGNPNDRENALSRAASKNHDPLGRFLVQQELSISRGVGFRYQRGETSLHFVVRTGNLNLTQTLLDAGWDVNAGERGVPLEDAVRYGHEDVSNLLIRRGSRTDQGLLHQAAEKGLISTAELLISVGADVNATDRQRRPIFEAAKSGPKEKYESFVRLLISNGARVDVKDSSGSPVILQASNSGDESVSLLFLKAGASPLQRRSDGTTVVHSAARHGHVNMIRALVKIGAELDAKDDGMRSALNFAAGGNHTEVIQLLLTVKPGSWINGNSVDEYQQPPLNDAISGGHVKAAHLLVDHQASIAGHDFVNWRYSSPLYTAVRNEKDNIVQMFMKQGGGTLTDTAFGEIVQEAVERGHLPTIAALLSTEAANLRDVKPLQATRHLPLAARRCKIEVVKLLLELGADVSDHKALNECIQCSDNPNFNNWKEWYDISKIIFLHDPIVAKPKLSLLLRAAASRNNIDGMRFWLLYGAPVGARYEDNKTVLHYAAASDASECLSVLLEMDAYKNMVNVQSKSGATALHTAVTGVKMYASSDSHLGVVKMLVAHGADISLRLAENGNRGENGMTALDVARKANLGLIVKFLERIAG